MTHDERVTADRTSIGQIIAAGSVAFWCEPAQLYYCQPCRDESRLINWQAVCEDDANAIAKELGKTTCDRCGKEIGHA